LKVFIGFDVREILRENVSVFIQCFSKSWRSFGASFEFTFILNSDTNFFSVFGDGRSALFESSGLSVGASSFVMELILFGYSMDAILALFLKTTGYGLKFSTRI